MTTKDLNEIIDADLFNSRYYEGVHHFNKARANKAIVNALLLEMFGTEVITRGTNHPALFYLPQLGVSVFLQDYQGIFYLYGYKAEEQMKHLTKPSDFADCIAIKGLPATTPDDVV